MRNPQRLFEKIRSLPDDCRNEVEDFVDFIAARAKDRALVRSATRASEASFARTWNNPDDDAYDAL